MLREYADRKNVTYSRWEITFSKTIMFTPQKKCILYGSGKVYFDDSKKWN